MPVLIASGNPLGFRALGGAGLAAIDAYGQIVSALRHRLGPEHAAMFAEPSRQGIEINWYATVDSPQPPVRLIEAPADRKAEGLRRLSHLLADITTLTTQLGKSDSQSERVLAGILENAIEIPAESNVYLVGVQPVMTFWGHVVDEDEPATGVLRALVRRAAEEPETPGPAGPHTGAKPASTGKSAPPPARMAFIAASRGAGQIFTISTAWVWLVLTLLLLTCGVELLRGCAIGLPHALTGWILNYCPAPLGPARSLADENARQDALRAEYDDLVQQAAARRQQCRLPAGGLGHLPPAPVVTPPETPSPVEPVKPAEPPQPVEPVKPVEPPRPAEPPQPAEPPKPDGTLKLPDRKETGLGFLEGCWQARKGLEEISNGKRTGHSIDETYCFDKSGKGRRIIVIDDGARCVGDLAATWTEDHLNIHSDSVNCNDKGHGTWQATNDTCTRASDGEAQCTEPDPADPAHPNFKDHPFTHVPGGVPGAGAGQP